jgi:hypothetical protein
VIQPLMVAGLGDLRVFAEDLGIISRDFVAPHEESSPPKGESAWLPVSLVD